MRNVIIFRLIGIAALLSFWACSDIVPVWVGQKKLDDLTLYYSDLPLEFDLRLKTEKTLDLRLELEITYYSGIGREDLPLTLIIEGDSLLPREFPVRITLKEGEQWQGIPDANEIDYSLTYEAISSISLKPGDYILKMYANDEKEEKIYGVTRIVARLFENKGAEATETVQDTPEEGKP
jgi:hypothetical protein